MHVIKRKSTPSRVLSELFVVFHFCRGCTPLIKTSKTIFSTATLLASTRQNSKPKTGRLTRERVGDNGSQYWVPELSRAIYPRIVGGAGPPCRIWILVLPLLAMIFSELFNFYESQFSHLQNGAVIWTLTVTIKWESICETQNCSDT